MCANGQYNQYRDQMERGTDSGTNKFRYRNRSLIFFPIINRFDSIGLYQGTSMLRESPKRFPKLRNFVPGIDEAVSGIRDQGSDRIIQELGTYILSGIQDYVRVVY